MNASMPAARFACMLFNALQLKLKELARECFPACLFPPLPEERLLPFFVFSTCFLKQASLSLASLLLASLLPLHLWY